MALSFAIQAILASALLPLVILMVKLENTHPGTKDQHAIVIIFVLILAFNIQLPRWRKNNQKRICFNNNK